MVALAGFNTGNHNDILKGADVATFLAAHMRPRVFQDIALINPMVNGTSWVIAQNDLIEVNVTLPEADEAAFTNYTTGGSTITPAVYPVRSFVSMELINDAVIDVVQKAILDHQETIRNAMDTNLLANISSATNTSNYAGTALDRPKFEAARLAFEKQDPSHGPQAFVGSNRQIADVIGSYADSGGSVFAAPGLISTAVNGSADSSVYFKGTVLSMALYAGDVPASGGADVSGAFVVVGNGLAIGFWNALDGSINAEGTPQLAYRLSDSNGRVGVELMTWSRYGTGIASQANVREVISLA